MVRCARTRRRSPTSGGRYLSDGEQAQLRSLLVTGAYRLKFPEQAALLAVASLLRSGDRAGALGLLDEIGAYAGQLCFTPVPDPAAEQDPSVVWRADAGEVQEVLAERRENIRVEAMREAITMWSPFADEPGPTGPCSPRARPGSWARTARTSTCTARWPSDAGRGRPAREQVRPPDRAAHGAATPRRR
nr:hypothetical protein [uncultured Actinoplanes sp.]